MAEIKFLERWADGLKAEDVVREILKLKDHKFAQLDLVSICNKTGKGYLYEVKHQERFDGKPFEGHGLSPYQVEFRLKFAEKAGLIPIFIVVEKPSGRVFYQRLDVLNKGKKFVTKTGKRVIYPLTSFKEYKR